MVTTILIRFYGYDQGVFGNVIISENFLETFGKHDNRNTAVYVQLLMEGMQAIHRQIRKAQ